MKSLIGAFTRVELLAVIFIVTLSISIFVPVLAAARKQVSYQAICAWKERMILRDIAAYANENDGWYPTACDVNGACCENYPVDGCLRENGYLRLPQVLWCPADQEFGPVKYSYIDSVNRYAGIVERNQNTARSYSFNIIPWPFEQGEHPGFKSVTQVKIPNRAVLISEVHTIWNLRYNPDHDPPICGMDYSSYFGPTPPNLKTTFSRKSGYSHWPGYDIYALSNPARFAHGEGLNFGFADGHVEYVEVDIQKEYPPFWWFDNGFYLYQTWQPSPVWR